MNTTSIKKFLYNSMRENNEANKIKTVIDYLYTINIYCDTVGTWYFNKMMSVLSILYLPINIPYYEPEYNRNTTYNDLLKIRIDILEYNDEIRRYNHTTFLEYYKDDKYYKEYNNTTLVDYLNYYRKIKIFFIDLYESKKITHTNICIGIIQYIPYPKKEYQKLCHFVNENLLKPIENKNPDKTCNLLEYQLKIKNLSTDDKNKIYDLFNIINNENKAKKKLELEPEEPEEPKQLEEPEEEVNTEEEIIQSSYQPAKITTNENNIPNQSNNKIFIPNQSNNKSFYFTVAIIYILEILFVIYIIDDLDEINNKKEEIDISNEDIIRNDDDNIENIQ